MKHLCHLIPFLENHIEFIDSDWGNELIRHWSYPHFIYESAFDYHWREGLVPTRISKNLYLAGNENFPYLGLEGEALSGWMVAREISRSIPDPGVFFPCSDMVRCLFLGGYVIEDLLLSTGRVNVILVLDLPSFDSNFILPRSLPTISLINSSGRSAGSSFGRSGIPDVSRMGPALRCVP